MRPIFLDLMYARWSTSYFSFGRVRPAALPMPRPQDDVWNAQRIDDESLHWDPGRLETECWWRGVIRWPIGSTPWSR